MDLRPLRHIVALAHHLHYRKAADVLGLTQPALSRSVQVTEERYGAKLFDRDRQGVRLTAVGRLFVERAEVLLGDAAEFERTVGRYSNGCEGNVSFGVSPSAARSCLPMLLRELSIERARLRVNVAMRSTSALVSMLIAEEIEFLICSKNQISPSANVSFMSFGSYSACFLVRAGHPLLSDASLDVSAFPIVAAGPLDGSDDLFKGLLDFFRYRPQMTVESAEALARLTENSDAVWMSSTFAAADEIARGTLVPLTRPMADADHPVELGLFRLRHRSISPISKEIGHRLHHIFSCFAPMEGT